MNAVTTQSTVQEISEATNSSADLAPAALAGQDWLFIEAYASAAHALPYALERGGFVAASLAETLKQDFSAPTPPLPPVRLQDDQALCDLFSGLPDALLHQIEESRQAGGQKEEASFFCLFQALARCGDVSLATIDQLSNVLEGHLAATLAGQYHLAEDTARYLAAEATNEAIARAMERAPEDRIATFMDELQAKGLISGERVLAYARRGNSPLFHAALGHSAELEAEMVAAFIEDGGLRVLERILLRTDFAPVMQQTILATFAESAGLT